VELWELVARESIRDLVARYNANGDSGRLAHVLELFADDATMELAGTGGHMAGGDMAGGDMAGGDMAGGTGDVRTFRGRAEIESIFTGAVSSFRDSADARSQPGYLRHCVATHQIDLVDRTHAKGRCYFFVIRAQGLDHWGRYLDEYEERDGRWLFTYRKVTTEGWGTPPAPPA
jgi:hypothetical protein